MASALSRGETSPSCRWGRAGLRTCGVGQRRVPPQPLQGLLPHLPVANGRAGPAPGVLEVLGELSGGGCLRAQGRLQTAVESNGQPWGCGQQAGDPASVLSGSFLRSPRMPLENLLWEAEAAVCP